jgi:hypothetical protein
MHTFVVTFQELLYVRSSKLSNIERKKKNNHKGLLVGSRRPFTPSGEKIWHVIDSAQLAINCGHT